MVDYGSLSYDLTLKLITSSRYRNVSEERLCQVCKTNVIKDDFHFISKCSIHNDIRLDYI